MFDSTRVFSLLGLLSLSAIAGGPRHGLSAQTARPLDVEYREVAGRLIGAAMVDRGGYDKLAYLTTRIGNRLSGSSGLEIAVAWVADGARLADTIVYDHLQPNGLLPAGYADAQVRLCRQQAVLAGTRLANLLNSLLDKRASRGSK